MTNVFFWYIAFSMFIHRLVNLSMLKRLRFCKLTKKRKPLPKRLLNGICFITGKKYMMNLLTNAAHYEPVM
nr:MAG TPA: hypothetical protein [Caudoviricetes sp.]